MQQKNTLTFPLATQSASTKIQGQDTIVINAPLERVWTAIADSKCLAEWGPPVKSVAVIEPDGQAEGFGSRRRVDAEFNGKSGYFIERRVEHIPQQTLAYLIEEETFGLFQIITEVGFRIQLEAIDTDSTRVIWSFFHNPKGVMGHILNHLVVLRQQRRNRLLALSALKHYAEDEM